MTNDEFRRSFTVPFHMSLGLAIYSCGVQRCGAGHSWGPAVRDHFLIHLVIAGKGIFSCGGETYRLCAGDGFLVEPDKIAGYTADSREPWEYCWVSFNGSDAKRLMEQTGLLQRGPVFKWGGDDTLLNCLMNVCNASGSKAEDEARMGACLLLFLARLMERFGTPSPQRTSGFAYVQKAIRFIDFNYSSEIDVEDIARSVGISRSHLYRLFMENVSMPPNEYLARFRINRAAALLEGGSLSVGEVAYSTGFEDQLYFSRVFKKYMGVPPSRYAGVHKKEGSHERSDR